MEWTSAGDYDYLIVGAQDTTIDAIFYVRAEYSEMAMFKQAWMQRVLSRSSGYFFTSSGTATWSSGAASATGTTLFYSDSNSGKAGLMLY